MNTENTNNTNILLVLELLANTSGKLDKREILVKHDSPELRKLLILGVSPYINFGVTVDPDIYQKHLYVECNNSNLNNSSLNKFFELATKLSTRLITGNNAKNAVDSFMIACPTQYERDWYAAVLNKKLRIGVDTAVNDVWPGSIPEFSPALAEDWNKVLTKPKAATKYCQFPKLQSVKLDGMRGLAIYDLSIDSFQLFSREGRPILGMPHIIEALNKHCDPAYVLDGELYSHSVVQEKGFQFLVGLLKRQNWNTMNCSKTERDKIKELDQYREKISYHIFDRVTLQDWNNKTNSEKLSDRLSLLETNLKLANSEILLYVPHKTIHTQHEMLELNGEFLSQGYEGSMLKDPDSNYEFKRSSYWLKYKIFQDAEFEITGYYEGEGKWARSLGGLNLITHDKLLFKCGGGRMSKEARDELWKIREDLIGKKATVRFFELTTDGIPRFPILYATRDYE